MWTTPINLIWAIQIIGKYIVLQSLYFEFLVSCYCSYSHVVCIMNIIFSASRVVIYQLEKHSADEYTIKWLPPASPSSGKFYIYSMSSSSHDARLITTVNMVNGQSLYTAQLSGVTTDGNTYFTITTNPLNGKSKLK